MLLHQQTEHIGCEAMTRVELGGVGRLLRDPPPEDFEFERAPARSVCLAGSFNDWDPAATEMIPDGDERWVKENASPAGCLRIPLRGGRRMGGRSTRNGIGTESIQLL